MPVNILNLPSYTVSQITEIDHDYHIYAYPMHLPNIESLIEFGEITVGVIRPMGCVAIASDGHDALAMLRRRNDETLQQLRIRLDQAIAKAEDGGEYTDEVNA